ncbi:MAG TPA: recombination regulator RecX [Usitatibacter sp.]|nr:recombination regulator RecX [Usitatibacter sp.]
MAWAFMGAPSVPSLKARAMRFLARREHSRAELRRKLSPKVAEGEDLEAVLDDLAERGWLSDARFAEHTARAKARRFGPLKLNHYLRSRGVDDDAIAAGVRAAGEQGAARMEEIWKSRFKAPPVDGRESARQLRFLQGRGFAAEDVFRFLKSLKASR